MIKRLLMILTVVICLLTPAMGNTGDAGTPLWLRYPAISPDGDTIVFCYKGDIFKVPAAGGQAQPLTSHGAYDFKPVWSPDSRFIAFASDRCGNFDIYILPIEGGEPKRLTYHSANETPNSFTPDGKFILFSAAILDHPNNVQFPHGVFSELYIVPVENGRGGCGRTVQVLTTPALEARYDKAGKHILYQDRKGVEDGWRKHHTSSVTRDIRLYDVESQQHTKLSLFNGEDLSPVFSGDEKAIYYLSEQFGTFNVCKLDPANPGQVVQMTHHEKHPVRFLSISNNDTLCYSYHGQIYTKARDREPMKVPIQIAVDRKQNPVQFQTLTDGATEIALSPDGKEVAFVARGEIFVASVQYGTTKRITDTPEQERSVSFSPDGRTLLYAGERNGSWNLYQTTITRKEEKHFSAATLLTEEPLLETPEETFQPLYSPDGKEVAYLEERTTLKVIDVKTRAIRAILDGKFNYSYTDGDMWFQWSPDGQQFLVTYFGKKRWNTNVGMVDAQGKQNIVNLTESGYFDKSPNWILDGKAMMWLSDREGMRSHGSWGSQRDVYAMFFDRGAFDRFRLSKEEFEAVKEKEKEEQEKEKEKDKKKENDKKKEKDTAKTFVPDLENSEDRLVRWTVNSSDLSDMVLSPDGESLYYLSKFESGHDLWVNKLREKETKLLVKLTGRGGGLQIDKEGKNLFLLSDGKILKVDTGDKKSTPIAFKAEFNLNREAEYAYLFEHIWRQVLKKFYRVDMAGVDWQFYKEAYTPFLSHIATNYEFSEMLSEMLGELNASHTGCFYTPQSPDGDETARLGAFYDESYTGGGLKIVEIIDKSPLRKSPSLIKPGVVIEKIDGQPITPGNDYYYLLNHKAGKPTLLSLYNPADGKRWEETVKPITIKDENELLYRRWVKNRREETERLSNGRIGYVHVRGMNDSSFRVTYGEMLGRYNDKEAMIVDTRFNGGGSLHEDLAKLLGGKKYFDSVPRGQFIGSDPRNQWWKPSVVLMSEGNYSNAHGFPYVYKKLGLGKLVGMPVPGTMTSVWWERLQDQTLVFGIPMVGYRDEAGHYLENQQLEPDFPVENDLGVLAAGRDQQLEKAVRVLLETLAKKE